MNNELNRLYLGEENPLTPAQMQRAINGLDIHPDMDLDVRKEKAKERRARQRAQAAKRRSNQIKRVGLPERPATNGVHPMGRRRHFR